MSFFKDGKRRPTKKVQTPSLYKKLIPKCIGWFDHWFIWGNPFFLFINLGNVCQCDPWGAHEGQSATDGGFSQLAGEEFYHREDGPHPTGTQNTHVPTVSHCPYNELLAPPVETKPLLWGFYFHFNSEVNLNPSFNWFSGMQFFNVQNIFIFQKNKTMNKYFHAYR